MGSTTSMKKWQSGEEEGLEWISCWWWKLESPNFNLCAFQFGFVKYKVGMQVEPKFSISPWFCVQSAALIIIME